MIVVSSKHILQGFAATAAIGCATWWVCWGRSPMKQRLDTPIQAEEGAEMPVAPDNRSDVATVEVNEAEVPTAREILTQFSGPLTSELENLLNEQGIKLDEPFEYLPWEEVADQIEATIGTLSERERQSHVDSVYKWPAALTADSLSQKFPLFAQRNIELSDLVVSEVDLLVSEDNFELGNLAEQYGDQFRDAIHVAWQSQTYLKSPISTRGLPRPEKRAIFASAGGFGGWGAKLYLFADDEPEIVAMQKQMAALRAKRDAKVIDYVTSLAH